MDLFHADGLGTATPSIIRVGENAWKQEKAERLALLVDGEAYFHVLDQALRQARHAITILGWDFNPDIRLRPAEPESPTLGDLLLSLVEANPDLTVRVLVWAMGPLYSGKSLKLFPQDRLGCPSADRPAVRYPSSPARLAPSEGRLHRRCPRLHRRDRPDGTALGRQPPCGNQPLAANAGWRSL